MTNNNSKTEYNQSQTKNPRKSNIYAAKLIADSIRTTLGPKGLDKLLVTELGESIITNDGATILKNMKMEHPIAQMMVQIAISQDEAIGDGTTSAVILAGELLKGADELIDEGIHPSQVIEGYNLALQKATSELEKISKQIDHSDQKAIKFIAETAMTGKANEQYKKNIANLIAKASEFAYKNNVTIDRNNINVAIATDNVKASPELINGLILEKNKCHPQMPDNYKNAAILTLDCPLETTLPENNTQINITNSEELDNIINYEQTKIKQTVEKIVNSGAKIVFCQKGIDETAQELLARHSILAFRRLKKSQMATISKICNSDILSSTKQINKDNLGHLDELETIKQSPENLIILKSNTSMYQTILLNKGTTQGSEEMKRATEDAIGVVSTCLKDKKIVAGGGACEAHLSKIMQNSADNPPGKQNLAIQTFAKSLEIIPKTLAQNCGLDALETLVKLKTNSSKETLGIDMETGNTKNTLKEGIIEPLQSKIHALKTATEVTNMILRIDDIILMPQSSTAE